MQANLRSWPLLCLLCAIAAVPLGCGSQNDGGSGQEAPGPASSQEARIQAYLDSRYTAGDVRHSFRTMFGETIDCIDFFAQRGVRELAARGTPITELPEAPRREGPMAEFEFNGSADESGHPRACPEGTVPELRITVADVLAAGNFDSPPRLAPPIPGPRARVPGVVPPQGGAVCTQAFGAELPGFAHVQETFNPGSGLTAGGATLSLFAPSSGSVPANSDHSLAQLWLYSGTGFNTANWSTTNNPGCTCATTASQVTSSNPLCTQSLEVGWDVDPSLVTNYLSLPNPQSPHLFTFSTSDGYNTGCYDNNSRTGTCLPWVATPGATMTPGMTLTASSTNELSLRIVQGSSGWNVVAGLGSSATVTLGYYPFSDYAGGPLAAGNGAATFQVGGEVYDQSGTFSVPMGSGGNPYAGYGTSAYVRNASVTYSGGTLPAQDQGEGPVTVPTSYIMYAYAPTPNGANWGNYFYFGDQYPAPTSCGTMVAGQAISVGEVLWSCDGRFALTLQSDGNLVIYKDVGGAWEALWASFSEGYPIQEAVMQSDGNFVIYDYIGNAYWGFGGFGPAETAPYTSPGTVTTFTEGNPGAYLVMQTDGNLCIYTASGGYLWCSGTGYN